MIPSELQVATTPAKSSEPAAAAPQPAAEGHGFTFHDLLSVLNPLQYLPGVGTIYRAVTGDVIPEAVRNAGSLLFSGLLGGPIGLITSVASTIAQKVTGIDLEKIVAAQFHLAPQVAAASAGQSQVAGAPAGTAASPDALLATPPAGAPVALASGVANASAETRSAAAEATETLVMASAPTEAPSAAIAAAWAASPPRALTPRQLAAYGVVSDTSGNLKLGDVTGAEVLNSMELLRLQTAAAYAASHATPSAVAGHGG
ncbi:MAG TPA: hypothetical protein VGC09_10410 [Rhodopila sp.]